MFVSFVARIRRRRRDIRRLFGGVPVAVVARSFVAVVKTDRIVMNNLFNRYSISTTQCRI